MPHHIDSSSRVSPVRTGTSSGQPGSPDRRNPAWMHLSAADVLHQRPPGKIAPEKALEMLLKLFNDRHTALDKSVSHKTRHDRAVFLRRFFRDLRIKAGFATIPDPRNLGGRHIQAMMDVWRRDQLAPPTVQTYLSFLRGLAGWIGKPGMVQRPGAYGWDRSEYERTGIAQRDKTWTGAGIDIDPLIAQVCAFDRHVGAALRLIRAFGLRRKEAVMMRPHACVVPFTATGLPLAHKRAETYLWVCQGSKGGRPRHVPITNAEQQEALAFAQAVAGGGDAHVSDPHRQLHQNLNHFSYVLRRFGLSLKDRGATAHGLRHELFVQVWREQTGTEPPVRGGGRAPKEREEAARQEIVEMAGHGRKRAAGAYVGSTRGRSVVDEAVQQLQELPSSSGAVADGPVRPAEQDGTEHALPSLPHSKESAD